MRKNSTLQKYTILAVVLVFVIVLVGFGMSYAFFSISFTGNGEVPSSSAATLNVTTTLTNAKAIDTHELAIIDAAEYKTKGEKVEFAVTNQSTSNVNAKYTIKLVEMSLSKKLLSQYFKWELVINEGSENQKIFRGNFADATLASEGNNDSTQVSNLTKQLITDADALSLNISQTDQIKFYIWLENDSSVNQLYLTEGTFSGKLSMDAVPSKN